MTLPPNVSLGTVTGRFLRSTDGVAHFGLQLTFEPDLDPGIVKDLTATPPVTIGVEKVRASTDGNGDLVFRGDLGVPLLDPNDPDISPNGWTWRCTIEGQSFPKVEFSFPLTAAGVDLTTVIPVPPNPGAEVAAWQAAVSATLANVAAAQAARSGAEAARDQAVTTVAAVTASLAEKAPLSSPAFTGTPTGITKTHVGLGNVDNTSDANKPVSTNTATALAGKAATTHTHLIAEVTDSTTVGKALVKATNAAAALTAIGAASTTDLATLAAPPLCRLGFTTDQTSSATVATFTTVTWSTEAIDTHGMHAGSAAGITVPTAGYYRLSAMLSFNGPATGAIQLAVNGAGVVDTQSWSPPTTGAWATPYTSTVLLLAAGAVVTVQAASLTASATMPGNRNRFEVEFVRA